MPIKLPQRRYREIEQSVLDLYEKTDVHTIPFDVLTMASKLGIQLISYISMSREAQQWAKKISKDAFMPWGMDDKPIAIFYNGKMPPCRLKFTIMHELAHACLRHKQHSKLAEVEANAFASTALCPLPLMERYGIEDAEALAHVFEISEECASHRLEQYTKWRRLPIIYRNVAFGMAVCNRFHLSMPYQPSLFSTPDIKRKCC